MRNNNNNNPKCVYKEENEKSCPCPEKDCPRHGICCLCIKYHKGSTQWPMPACFR